MDSAGDASIHRSFEFRADADAPLRTREALDGLVSDVVGEGRAADVRIAASELVTNAIRHGGMGTDEQIRVSVHSDDQVMRVEVEQPTSTSAAHVVPDGERIGRGFGLALVEQLSTRWGARSGVPGAVWFEVPVRAEARLVSQPLRRRT